MTDLASQPQGMLLRYPTEPGLQAFSTTRHGGVSHGTYATFNANHYCGDNHDDVRTNRQRLADALSIPYANIIVPHQTHSVNIAIVNTPTTDLEDIDAVVTDRPGLCLCVSTADCIPVLLYDNVHHAIAAIHAGWRGTLNRIVERTISRMQEAYDTKPAQLNAIIGPGISQDSFEVGDEVYEAFSSHHFPMPQIARRYPMMHQSQTAAQPQQNTYQQTNGAPTDSATRTEKWHIDLWEANRLQLISRGVLPTNIHVAGICTYKSHADFFSARRLGIKSGRILTGILIDE